MRESSNAIARGEDQPSSSGPATLKVALLADGRALYQYGPVLRRLAVGLIDEVAELTLVSLAPSPLLDFLPCPPLRLITETRDYGNLTPKSLAGTTRQITLNAPRWSLIDRLLPDRHVTRIAEALSKYKPNLLHALSEGQMWLARRLSKQLKIPYVVSLLAMEKRRLSFSETRCGAILPCNSFLARRLRETQPRLAKRVQLLPIGTHVPDTPCCLGHGEAPFHIVCCAPLGQQYGLGQLLRAVARLKNQGDTFRLTLSGKGPAERDLRRKVQELDLIEEVQFIPPVDEIIFVNDAFKVLLKEADVFVQPWPASIWRAELLEAMSVGAAVVTPDGNHNDLIVPDHTALTYAPDNEKELTDRLTQLINDREQTCRLARNAQQHLRKHFLASGMVETLVQAYRRALDLKLNGH